MKLTDTQIAKLEERGFTRWTKNGMDRLYINATRCGLVLDYYKTGNIHYAELNGEHISNSRAYAIKTSKNYIDIADGSVHSDHAEIRENIVNLLDEIQTAQ